MVGNTIRRVSWRLQEDNALRGLSGLVPFDLIDQSDTVLNPFPFWVLVVFPEGVCRLVVVRPIRRMVDLG